MRVREKKPAAEATVFDGLEGAYGSLLGARIEKVEKHKDRWYCPSHGFSCVCIELGCTVYEAPEYLLSSAGRYLPVRPGNWVVAVPSNDFVYPVKHEVLTKEDFQKKYGKVR